MGAVAQFERSLNDEQATEVAQRLDEGESASALAREYSVNRSTIYNARDRSLSSTSQRTGTDFSHFTNLWR